MLGRSLPPRIKDNLTKKSDAELREIFDASRETLALLVHKLANRPDMQNAIRRLMRPDDMLETFSELAVKEPDLMRLVLQARLCQKTGLSMIP